MTTLVSRHLPRQRHLHTIHEAISAIIGLSNVIDGMPKQLIDDSLKYAVLDALDDIEEHLTNSI